MFELFRKGEVLPVGRSNDEEARLLTAKKEDGKGGNIQHSTPNIEQPMKGNESLLTSAPTKGN
jgi:hypothetical protein